MAIYADYSNRAEPFVSDSPRGREWTNNTRSVADQIKDALVRADSVDGLKMTEVMDGSNRPIRTFELVGNSTKRSTWMAAYCAEPHLQIRINKKAGQPDSVYNNVYQARWEEDQRQIASKAASGHYTLPEF